MMACSAVQADIYTWVDKSGRINVSNVEPPAGVRVTSVQRTSPASAAAVKAFQETLRQSEVQALEERVQKLQEQVSATARQPPPQRVEYHVVVAAPAYVGDPAPPPAFYEPPAPTAPYAGCDPSWIGCTGWWNPGIYPVGVVSAATPRHGRHHSGRGGRPITSPGFRPVAPPGGVGPIPPPLIRPSLQPVNNFPRLPVARPRR
jgi:hypothetical protein